MITSNTFKLWTALKNGLITNVQLESLLANPTYQTAFSDIVTSRHLFKTLGESSTAMAIVAGSSSAISTIAASDVSTDLMVRYGHSAKVLFTTQSFYGAYTATSGAYARLQNAALKTYSKCKIVAFPSSGTYTPPANGVLAFCAIALGGGGGGGSQGSSSTGGDGGGGGQTRSTGAVVAIGPNAITGPVTVTVGGGGAAGSGSDGGVGGDSLFGTFLTAKGGLGGKRQDAGGGLGGSGGTPLGSFASYTNKILDTGFHWIFDAINIVGQDGTTGVGGTNGTNGFYLSDVIGSPNAVGTFFASSNAGAPGKYGVGGTGAAGSPSTGYSPSAGSAGFVVLYVIEG